MLSDEELYKKCENDEPLTAEDLDIPEEEMQGDNMKLIITAKPTQSTVNIASMILGFICGGIFVGLLTLAAH